MEARDGGGANGGGDGSDEDTLDGGIVTDVADPALRGLLQALALIATAAERAADRAENGDADNALRTVRERIRSARVDLEAEDHDDEVESVTARRLEQAERRAGQALETGKSN